MANSGVLEALGIGPEFQESLKTFWVKNNLKLDVPVIDLQHIWLVYLIMELEKENIEADGAEFPLERITKIMGDLLSFAAEHFSVEEDLFLAFELPDAIEHSDRHRNFVQFLSQRASEVKAGQHESVKVLISFLKDWLTMHILKDDKHYADFYRDSGVNLRQYFQRQIEKHALTIDRGQVAVYKLVSESDEVREIVRQRLAELDERLQQMQRYREALARTLAQWDKREKADGHFCGLIEEAEFKATKPASALQKRRGK